MLISQFPNHIGILHKHDDIIAMLCAKLQNDWVTERGVMDEEISWHLSLEGYPTDPDRCSNMPEQDQNQTDDANIVLILGPLLTHI